MTYATIQHGTMKKLLVMFTSLEYSKDEYNTREYIKFYHRQVEYSTV